MNLPYLHCLRCHHTWVPRKVSMPKLCPNCTSYLWNREYSKKSSVTPGVLVLMSKCRFALCQNRLAVLQGETVLLENKSAKSIKIKKPQLKVHEVTPDNLPSGFRRIKA